MNPYYRHSKIPTEIFLILVWMFASDQSIFSVCLGLGLSERSVSEIFRRLRKRLEEHSLASPPLFEGTVQADVFDFSSPRRTPWRGPRVFLAERPLIFGFMNAQSNVYVFLVPDRKKETLQPAIEKHVVRGSNLITSGWGGWGNLLNLGMAKHRRVKVGHSQGLWFRSDGECLSKFWEFVDWRIRRMRGVQDSTFLSVLKECEFRWNLRDDPRRERYKLLVRILLERPL